MIYRLAVDGMAVDTLMAHVPYAALHNLGPAFSVSGQQSPINGFTLYLE